MQPVEPCVSGIEAVLKNIDETKATGPGGISARILKRCAYQTSVCLFNLFWDTGHGPFARWGEDRSRPSYS